MTSDDKKRMRITKVYTRVGDRGMTGLVGGAEVSKSDPRIESYGTVDELNAVVGIARTFNDPGDSDQAAALDQVLASVQNDLFNVGADLATRVADRWAGMFRVGDKDVKQLEDWCDTYNEELGPLTEFILPGGGPCGAFLHQARTVCRRAERRVVHLIATEDADVDGCLRYLNRLSDLLFVLARWSAKLRGVPEYLWQRPEPDA